MERQPIVPPPGYTGPTPNYASTPAELAVTAEQPAQPPVEEVVTLPAAAEQTGVPKQTVAMDRPPEIPPPSREPSGASVPVPSKPAIEAGGPPRTEPPSYVPAKTQPRALDRPPNKLPLYIGIGVGVVILIIIIIIAAT
jgi:hypothetical protein